MEVIPCAIANIKNKIVVKNDIEIIITIPIPGTIPIGAKEIPIKASTIPQMKAPHPDDWLAGLSKSKPQFGQW